MAQNTGLRKPSLGNRLLSPLPCDYINRSGAEGVYRDEKYIESVRGSRGMLEKARNTPLDPEYLYKKAKAVDRSSGEPDTAPHHISESRTDDEPESLAVPAHDSANDLPQRFQARSASNQATSNAAGRLDGMGPRDLSKQQLTQPRSGGCIPAVVNPTAARLFPHYFSGQAKQRLGTGSNIAGHTDDTTVNSVTRTAATVALAPTTAISVNIGMVEPSPPLPGSRLNTGPAAFAGSKRKSLSSSVTNGSATKVDSSLCPKRKTRSSPHLESSMTKAENDVSAASNHVDNEKLFLGKDGGWYGPGRQDVDPPTWAVSGRWRYVGQPENLAPAPQHKAHGVKSSVSSGKIFPNLNKDDARTRRADSAAPSPTTGESGETMGTTESNNKAEGNLAQPARPSLSSANTGTPLAAVQTAPPTPSSGKAAVPRKPRVFNDIALDSTALLKGFAVGGDSLGMADGPAFGLRLKRQKTEKGEAMEARKQRKRGKHAGTSDFSHE